MVLLFWVEGISKDLSKLTIFSSSHLVLLNPLQSDFYLYHLAKQLLSRSPVISMFLLNLILCFNLGYLAFGRVDCSFLIGTFFFIPTWPPSVFLFSNWPFLLSVLVPHPNGATLVHPQGLVLDLFSSLSKLTSLLWCCPDSWF